ncbi:hypothetical protein [Brachybacterium squillarum]|uniref:hypothetical protein n=1 Tax=Brachybacterium squillarum TaxID=661979 RepID=UPI002222E049|nr:hypothetical protein [Brachybacterium squillarum]MCW1805455.1 hypothetical protein [Brachybacterium squillarum]
MTDSPLAGRDLLALPRGAVLMLWAAAYLRGDVGPDDAAELAHGASGGTTVPGGEDLFAWLTGLRRLPLAQLRLVLPVPGRLAGLVGPPPAIAAALAAEQAVVVTAAGIADHTLVPSIDVDRAEGPRGPRVTWQRFAAPLGAQVPPPASSGRARTELLTALQEAARSTVDLDIVPDEPVPPDRIPAGWTATGLPRHLEGSQAHLLVLAGRTLLLSQGELADPDPGARQLSDALARREILARLQETARAALVETVERVVHTEMG